MSNRKHLTIPQLIFLLSLLTAHPIFSTPLRGPVPSLKGPGVNSTEKQLHPFKPHHSTDGFDQHLYPQSEILSWPAHVRRSLPWSLQIEYSGTTFFDGWEFFTQPDPSHGLVNYVDGPTAFQEGLAFWTADSQPGIQVEHWSDISPGSNRNSVRISTKSLFAGGLFVIDMAIMPWGCGVWPAFWTLGYAGSWPSTGEIDIIEGIMDSSHNQMTIHTLPGCSIDQAPGLYTGSIGNPLCDSTTGGSGCGIISDSNTSYGNNFNNVGGGVFAMKWDGDGIRIWNWNRAYIPSDITGGTPSPDSWGTPAAAFDASTCDPGYYFQAQELILNIDLCGDWAGQLYSQFSYCPGTCQSYIATGSNLQSAVMIINSIQVYQQSGTSPIGSQAATNSNQTGAGGAVGHTSKAMTRNSGSHISNILGMTIGLLGVYLMALNHIF